MLGGRVGVMAYHGGDLEVGTDHVAEAVAEATGASLYAVRQPEGMRWHIPSDRCRPEHSDRLAAFVDHVDTVITIHGFGRRRMFRSVLLGGRNRGAAGVVGWCLRRHLPDYEIIDRLDDIPRELRGLHRHNPVNLPPRQGVQIELPPRIRGNGPFWNLWQGGFPTPHTARLVEGLSEAVQRLAQDGLPDVPADQGARRSRTQPPAASRR